jgi:ribosomal protein S18 acetylase RimI-like enzyme
VTASLAFRTDLALLAAQGAEIATGPGGSVVRMPGNPAFRWGNFLLVPEAGDPAARIRDHEDAFPGAGFTTVGVDDAAPTLDEGAWRAAGFAIERHAVLVADRAPAVPIGSGPVVRPLASEADWAVETAIAISLDEDDDGDVDPEQADFSRRRTAEKRRLTERGRAVWLGAEQDGTVVATAGVADAGDRVARFQDVQTAAAHRRRGCASALIAAGVRIAADRFGSVRFVLVAERDGPAIGLYRRLGFREVETQLQLTRLGGSVGGTA